MVQNSDNMTKIVRSEIRVMRRAMTKGGNIEEKALIEKYILNCASLISIVSSISC